MSELKSEEMNELKVEDKTNKSSNKDEERKINTKDEKNKKGRNRIWPCFIRAVLILLALSIASSILFLDYSWASMTVEEMLYHVKVSLKGTNPEIIRDYILICVLTSFAGAGLYLTLDLLSKQRKKHRTRLIFHVAKHMFGLSTIGYLLVCLWMGYQDFNVALFIKGQTHSSTFIEDNYVDPSDVELKFPEKKRNVIYIYLESMEITYTDDESGGVFPENVIPELTQLARDNEDFSGSDTTHLNGAVSHFDTDWTMAAMFAQTTGLPLKIPMGQNQMIYEKTFFPGVTSFGDILEENGYQNVFLLGSDSEFGGRKLYFSEHGNYELRDYPWAQDTHRIPKDYKVWWGYEDDKLFQYAQEAVKKFQKEDQPFNLTMLTVDTHFEDGHWCRMCTNDFDNRYADIMHCSSRQVTRFIDWLQTQPCYENTTIIITGDHPTMDRDFCNDVPKSYQRKVYTCYINSAVKPEEDTYREYSTFDAFPTSLAAMGVEIPGNRLGLGTNLFSTEATLDEKYSKKKIDDEIVYKSDLMKELYQGKKKNNDVKKTGKKND